MNKWWILCLVAISLVACGSKKEEPIKEYDYEDVGDQMICWNEILSIDSESYYAYIFSRTCGHCNEIKQQVISYALNNKERFYFVEYSKDIPIITDASSVIGKDNVCDIGIVGTPSMFLVANHVVMENIVGSKNIVKTLTNE